MFYEFELEIAKNTPKDSLAYKNIKLTAGIIKRIEIQFPAGCAGLAHVRMRHGNFQLFPSNPDGFFTSDDWSIGFNDKYVMIESPYNIKLEGYNEDDTYPHTILFRISVLAFETISGYVEAEEEFVY